MEVDGIGCNCDGNEYGNVVGIDGYEQKLMELLWKLIEIEGSVVKINVN